jgi:hypothetical protein
MLEDERQYLDHLAVAARRLEHALLKCPEGRRQLGEGRAVAQSTRLTLNDGEIVPPVEDGGRARALVGTREDAGVLADDLPLGGDDDTLGVNPHANGPIGERRRHAIPIAVEVDQACRRDALGIFDEAVERPGKRHQLPRLLGPGVGYRAWMGAVRRLSP